MLDSQRMPIHIEPERNETEHGDEGSSDDRDTEDVDDFVAKIRGISTPYCSGSCRRK